MDLGFGEGLLLLGLLLSVAAVLSGVMHGTVLSVSVLSVGVGVGVSLVGEAVSLGVEVVGAEVVSDALPPVGLASIVPVGGAAPGAPEPAAVLSPDAAPWSVGVASLSTAAPVTAEPPPLLRPVRGGATA